MSTMLESVSRRLLMRTGANAGEREGLQRLGEAFRSVLFACDLGVSQSESATGKIKVGPVFGASDSAATLAVAEPHLR